jgi:hypothetical protein
MRAVLGSRVVTGMVFSFDEALEQVDRGGKFFLPLARVCFE